MDYAIASQPYPEQNWGKSASYTKYNSANSERNLMNILQQMHSSLDPRTVFASYGKTLGQLLPIQGLQLNQQLKLNWGRCHGLNQQRVISGFGEPYSIKYYLTAPLTPSQTLQLNKLESLFSQPFFNAIKFDQMSNKAMFDALTGLGNRYYYRQTIKNALARANRNQGNIALLVLDLDNFKSLNDKHGHKLGDTVLSEFAELINEAIRNTDQAFRIGGDEFIIIAQGNELEMTPLCQRIIAAMAEHPLMHAFNVQCSIGVTDSTVSNVQDKLYEAADKALYSAKAAGRNCFNMSNKNL
ncbi:GGDEF domain-containing protein [Shewanella sp. 10N.7]|uniref:diguanylate cyclase DgcS n=1 Tax=Shewanella sp. 10N.7 TaxID=2885093 RepID=UPI001E2C6C82|nr:GGDEF domain-containing protein [Shewanella sp. 10N.7]MCC4831018.1 GGDEF domain-containing protein [Shewanella sp. 10N.7]